MTIDFIETYLIKLRTAIKFKRKDAILEAYIVLEKIDWEYYPTEFPAYDKLVTKANDILYS